MSARAQFAPTPDDPLHDATPAVDDVEARRARAAIENRLFSGPTKRVQVGRYRVEGKIGAGGMGVVYRAHDPQLARDIALKLLNTESIPEHEAARARGRLIREARTMARLAHPNVIHVYDVGAVEEGVFIAMELVEGDPLSTWIEREAPRWEDTLQCYLDAGKGLAAAHEAGIIHRDFKPENVLLGADGRVRVGDFGLAGSSAGDPSPLRDPSTHGGPPPTDQGSVNASLTRTGTLLGTPKYMAPEQEMGLGATARSDQFGFCVALYEGLYGHPPFAGETVLDYRRAVSEEAVIQPSSSDVPAWIFEVLSTGMRRDPRARHASMRQLLLRLSEALDRSASTRGKQRRAGWIGALGGGVGLTVGLALAMAHSTWSSAPRGPVSAVVSTPDSGSASGPASAMGGTVPPGTSFDPSDTSSHPSGSTPGSAGPQPAAPDVPAAEPAPPRVKTETGPAKSSTQPPRKRSAAWACYYKEDKRSFLHASKRRETTFVVDSVCYSCRSASAHVVTTLSPPKGKSCRTSHLCTATREGGCDSE